MASKENTTVDQEQLQVALDQWNQFTKATTWATVAVIVSIGFLALITL